MDSRTVFRKGDFHVEEDDHDGFQGMSGGDNFAGKIGGSFKPAAGIGRVKAPSVSSGQGEICWNKVWIYLIQLPS